MTHGAHDLEFLRAHWWRLPELDALERGALSPEGFADAFIGKWRLDLGRAEFLEAFKHWVVRPFDGVADLLQVLASRHRLACLSNVNALHWERCRELGVADLFDAHYLSHDLGMRKPEAEIYAAVAADLGVGRSDIVFFDDVPANIDAARDAGMKAELVTSPGAIAEALARAGVC